MPPLPPSKRLLRTALAMLAIPMAAYAADQPAQSAQPTLQLAPDNDPVVAKINGQVVHKSDVVRVQKALGPQAAQMPLQTIYPRLIDRIVDVYVLADAARAEKLQDSPDVKADIAWSTDNVLAGKYVKQIGEKAITDDELHARYQKMIADKPSEPEIHARHILVPTEAEAKDIIAQLEKGADFAKLANEKSQDKGDADGGDLGWFTKDKMVPEFSAAAFKLKKGEYTKAPVKSQFGWHVIKVEDTRQTKPPTFDEVKDQLRQEIGNQAVQTQVEELKKKDKVEEFNLDGTPMTPVSAKPAAAPPAPTATAKP